MANRVLIGKRGSDHGLFVSRAGQNVATSEEPLGFDSRAVESLIVHSYGQNVLVPNVQNGSGNQLGMAYDISLAELLRVLIIEQRGHGKPLVGTPRKSQGP